MTIKKGVKLITSDVRYGFLCILHIAIIVGKIITIMITRQMLKALRGEPEQMHKIVLCQGSVSYMYFLSI